MTTTNKGLNQPAFDSLNWDVPLNQNAGWIDEALAGASSISVTGVSATPVVLTLSQYRPKAIIFTGTLSANVTYRIPSGIGGEWVIVNSTTGAFTLTIDSAAGGPAAVIPQGETSMVYTNGGSSVGAVVLTGVTPSVQSALNGKQNVEPTLTALAAYNTNGILTQTAADTFTGRTITSTASQITVTNGDGVSGDPTISAVIASQASAEAGTGTDLMTAQRVEQHMTANALGWGQTWQDVTGSRAFSTVYQNTTGRPIFVAVYIYSLNTAVLQVSPDNVTWITVSSGGGYGNLGDEKTASTIVPNNYYYRQLNQGGNPVILSWSELR